LWLWWLLTIFSEARLSVASFKVRPSFHMWRRWFKKRRDDDKDIVRKQADGGTVIYVDSYEGSGDSIGGDGGDGGGGDGDGATEVVKKILDLRLL
jgi:hypothetical protein